MIQPRHHFVAFLSLVFLAFSVPIYPVFDNPHFYRATNFFYDPRLGQDWMTTFDATIGRGSSSESAAKDPDCFSPLTLCRKNDDTPLLDLYGTHSMHQLGVNVPNKDLTNPLDLLLSQLALVPARKGFATYSIGGSFHIIESNLALTQNFTRGFFAQVVLPIRKLEIKDICFKDLSPTDAECPNVNHPLWQSFMENFNAILARYCLKCTPFEQTGVGDFTILAGWTHNYQETTILDFVDTTFRAGVIIPTSKERDESCIFSLPLGYNGHVGVPLSFDFAFGAYEWLTLGFHFDAIVFVPKEKCIRVKTSVSQSGLIKLAQADGTFDKGSIWTANAFFKADHFARGLSALVGYSYVLQNKDEFTPCDSKKFCPSIVNSDEMLKGFKMHTLHLMFEYDFTKPEHRYGPRLGIFYNREIGGKRIFKTDMVGFTFGLDIRWEF